MSLFDTVWFPRFGDIPGVAYETPSSVSLNRLKKRNMRPEQTRYRDTPSMLMWGSTSASPANEHFRDDDSDFSVEGVLANVAEALELPGIASDYHFGIQGAVQWLWKRRYDDAGVFDEVERLCWLDLQLIQSQPQAVSMERDGATQYFRVVAFQTLVTMYSTEGALTDAVRVLDLARRFEQSESSALEKIRSRHESLMAEDAEL